MGGISYMSEDRQKHPGIGLCLLGSLGSSTHSFSKIQFYFCKVWFDYMNYFIIKPYLQELWVSIFMRTSTQYLIENSIESAALTNCAVCHHSDDLIYVFIISVNLCHCKLYWHQIKMTWVNCIYNFSTSRMMQTAAANLFSLCYCVCLCYCISLCHFSCSSSI